MQISSFGRHCRHALIAYTTALIFAQGGFAQDLQLAETMEGGETTSTEGHLTIEWQQGTPPYRLIQSVNTSTGEPITLYEGEDHSYFMTGLLGGESRFTIEDSGGESVDQVVNVDYPSQVLVFVSLTVGTCLLAALIGIVYTGNRRYV